MSQNPKGNALLNLIKEQRNFFPKNGHWVNNFSEAHRGPRDPRKMEVSPEGRPKSPDHPKGLVGRRKKGQEKRVEED